MAGLFLAGHPLSPGSLGAPLLMAGLLLSYAYAFNQYIDEQQAQGPWWHRGPLLAAIPLVWTLPALGKASAAIFCAIAYFYSGGLRLKQLPLVGTSLNALGFPLLCLLGVDRLAPPVLALLGMTTCWVGAAQLVHELAHEADDRRAGLFTTAMALGDGKSRIAAAALLLAAAAASFHLGPLYFWTLLAYAVVVSVFTVLLAPARLRTAIRVLGMLWAAIVASATFGVFAW